MIKIIIANQNPVFNEIVNQLSRNYSVDYVNNKEKLTYDYVNTVKPDWVFFIHWSHRVPPSIHANFRCILFHMTDLPYGRGGSPLQNLILRGHAETKMTALKMESELDSGAIYLKRPLSLKGSAREIFVRATSIITNMIKEIIEEVIQPQPQSGDVVIFKRRKPEEGNIVELTSLDQVYDYIRMLDADGYPHAFIEFNGIRMEFCNASKSDDEIIANVRIFKK